MASSDFLKIMGISSQKGANRVIVVSFDHFASSDFNVWLRSSLQRLQDKQSHLKQR